MRSSTSSAVTSSGRWVDRLPRRRPPSDGRSDRRTGGGARPATAVPATATVDRLDNAHAGAFPAPRRDRRGWGHRADRGPDLSRSPRSPQPRSASTDAISSASSSCCPDRPRAGREGRRYVWCLTPNVTWRGSRMVVTPSEYRGAVMSTWGPSKKRKTSSGVVALEERFGYVGVKGATKGRGQGTSGQGRLEAHEGRQRRRPHAARGLGIPAGSGTGRTPSCRRRARARILRDRPDRTCRPAGPCGVPQPCRSARSGHRNAQRLVVRPRPVRSARRTGVRGCLPAPQGPLGWTVPARHRLVGDVALGARPAAGGAGAAELGDAADQVSEPAAGSAHSSAPRSKRSSNRRRRGFLVLAFIRRSPAGDAHLGQDLRSADRWFPRGGERSARSSREVGDQQHLDAEQRP